jgi:hypothetical protein
MPPRSAPVRHGRNPAECAPEQGAEDVDYLKGRATWLRIRHRTLADEAEFGTSPHTGPRSLEEAARKRPGAAG